MDEQEIARRVLQSTLGAVASLDTRHIRLINLSVYDRQLDPDLLTTSFQTLARGTIAQDAQVRLRFRTTESLAQLPDPIYAKMKMDGACLDGVEVD